MAVSKNYTFIKYAELSALTQDLKYAKIYDLLESIQIIGNVIKVTAKRVLNFEENQKLHTVILNHYSPSPTEQFVKQKVMSAMQFGQQLLIEIATENIMLGFTTNQVATMIAKYGHIMGMLQSGSLYTAITALEAIVPDNMITQLRKEKYIKKIKEYLGV